METAIFWVEHVARHKGAPHLRSAAVDLPFYVYYSFDIYLFCILVVLALRFGISKIICSYCSASKQNMQKQKTQ